MSMEDDSKERAGNELSNGVDELKAAQESGGARAATAESG